jgi:hypothetical protein
MKMAMTFHLLTLPLVAQTREDLFIGRQADRCKRRR